MGCEPTFTDLTVTIATSTTSACPHHYEYSQRATHIIPVY